MKLALCVVLSQFCCIEKAWKHITLLQGRFSNDDASLVDNDACTKFRIPSHYGWNWYDCDNAKKDKKGHTTYCNQLVSS